MYKQDVSDPSVNEHDMENISHAFLSNVARIIIGKKEVVEMMLIALICEGHILLEDVPGLGKTLLAKSICRTLNCGFKRIQCTPDLLPSDVTGIHFFNQQTSSFEFRPGPVITNILLVDEINRALPRTQSCLLECMQERQITIDIETVDLPRPFMIIATQNPIDMEGTFPLPEAQMDRFLMRLSLGHPTAEEEYDILSRFESSDPLETLTPVMDAGHIISLKNECRKVIIQDDVRKYIIRLCSTLREHAQVKIGPSPRASLGIQAAAQARAVVRGRTYVLPDDVKALAIPILAHRLLLETSAKLKGVTEQDLVLEVLASVAVPI